MMRLNILKFFLSYITAGLLLALFSGCGLEDLADYSSPGASYESYLRHAKTLRINADHRSYRRAIRCFTEEDRNWFESNFTLLKKLDGVEIEEDVYRHLYLTKRKAYIFGRAVVPRGPDLWAGYEIEMIDEENAVLSVEGYDEKIDMVKTSRGWQMRGLFGIRDKVQK